MFTKILIAEDTFSTNQGLVQSLDSMVGQLETAQYCDEAFLKIKKSIQESTPFQLLITDLSFDESYRERRLASGEDLIAAVRKIQPNLKIMVFSLEYRIGKIRQLLDEYDIEGYIHKSRDDIKEIKKGLEQIYLGKNYLSADVDRLLKNDDNIEDIDEVNIFILQQLAQGIAQKDIPAQLKKNSFPNYRLRSVQDRVNKLKELLGASNPAQLVSIAKDQGFI